MSRFAGARDAKEFLVARIAEEAQREGVSLSEVERKMLYFSETAWTLRDMQGVSDQFDRRYDPDEYEDKIARLIRRARKRARQENPQDHEAWADAIRTLRKEDHYILLMVKLAGGSARPPGDLLKLWTTAIAIICIALLVLPFLPSPPKALFLFVWIIAAGAAAAYVLCGVFLGRQRADELTDKLTSKLFGPFGLTK